MLIDITGKDCEALIRMQTVATFNRWQNAAQLECKRSLVLGAE